MAKRDAEKSLHKTLMQMGLKLHTIKFVPASEIPQKQRKSVISSLPIWDDLRQVLDAIRKGDIAPAEEAIEINLDDPDIKKMLRDEKGRELKRSKMAVTARIRAMLKESGLGEKLEMTTRGNRIFLASRAD
jgi:hypothetical protein